MKILGFEIKRAVRKGELPPITQERSRSNHSSPQLKLQLGTYPGLVPTFSILNNFTDSEAYMSALRTNAVYCSKGVFSSVRILKDGEQKHDWTALDRILQFRPNPINCAAVFWERVALFYFHYNNAFIYIERDAYGSPIALWAPDPAEIQFCKLESNNELVLRFIINGKTVIYPYSQMAHIANTVIDDHLFGVQNKSLKRILNLINTNYQGIEQAIVQSAYIRFLGKIPTKLSPESLRAKAEDLTDNYLRVGSDKDPVSVLVTDSSLELTEVGNGVRKTATYNEMKQFNEIVYKFLGCPEDVIAGKATEDGMVAYYERTIDPFYERLTQELTEKIFSRAEFDKGNRIVFSDRKLQYLSMKTRLEIFNAAREIGAFALGTLGDLLGLPVPHNKRNLIVTSQNYSHNQQGKSGDQDGGGEDGKQPNNNETKTDEDDGGNKDESK